MILCLACWLCAPGNALEAGPLPGEGAEDIAAADHAFLELAAGRDAYYLHELIRIEVRIGIDARFFEDNAIQLFRRRLDVPVQLEAGWLEDFPGTIVLDADGDDDAGGERLGFALNDGVAEALRIEDRSMDGRTFTMLKVEGIFLPLQTGMLEIPAPKLRFAFATRFFEDLVSGRVPEDRRDAVLTGEGLNLRIEPLPEEGRPMEFFGAVGRFSIEAEAYPLDLEVGESLKLVLRIEGEGNMKLFDPPGIDRLDGFHVYGSIDHRGERHRTFTFDLAPLSDAVKEVPPIPFVFFDTDRPARYRTIRTEPIPIAVRPLPEGARLELLPGEAKRMVPGENDIFDIRPAAELVQGKAKRRISLALLACVLLAPWILALGLSLWLRARERDRADPDGKRARQAAALFKTRMARPDADLAEAFAEYLAARMRCASAAVITPDLEARLEAAGVEAGLARRAATLLTDLVAAHYGGGASDEGREAVDELVHSLDDSFQGREP
jgi:hypothetical protein